MKTKMYGRAIGLVLGAALSVLAAQAQESESDCQQALSNFKNADPGMQNLIQQSAGYAIFPNVGKGGFIVGGARGKGCVFQGGKMVGHATMTQATIGAQAGGQSYSELIVFQTSTALNDFKNSNFEMRAGVSAVAAAQGASQVAKFNEGVAVFTLARRGLMAEAAVGGQKFKFQPIGTR